MHLDLLPRLFCTLLLLLGLSHASPNPQATGDPPTGTYVVSVNSANPVVSAGIGTGITITASSDNATNTTSASDNVVDGVDLTDFNFNLLQMPTQTGFDETETIEAFQPLTRPSAAPYSVLTSRSISDNITLYANDGSTTTRNGSTVYSVAVNATAMKQMFQDATAYALNQFKSGSFFGNESDHNYYRFTSQGLTIAAMAYGEAGSGNEPFNWGDFSLITGFLTNLTIKYPDNNMTWNGYVSMADKSRGVDFFVVPSFGDILDSSQPAPAATTAASNPIGGADGGLRLAKRAYSVNLGVENVRMTVRKATTQIMTGLLYHLSSAALTTLVADSGQNPSYREFVMGSGDPALERGFPNQVMQIVATNQLLSREVVMAALQVLTQATYESKTHAGSTSALYGELVVRGQIIARWSLGATIFKPTCVVRNPDGSIAIGCFIRDF